MSTVPAPMVESKRSDNPRFEHTLRSVDNSIIPFVKSCGISFSPSSCFTILTTVFFSAPLELRNSLEISTIVLPFHVIVSLALSVTVATGVASKFSLSAR